MNSFIQIPSAPMKPSREDALRRIIYDTIAYGNCDSYCDEEAIISECIANHNWRPLSSEIELLIQKHSWKHSCPKNECVECNVDMGPNNPRQLCGHTYCMNKTTITCDDTYDTISSTPTPPQIQIGHMYSSPSINTPITYAPVKPSRETVLRNAVLDALATYNTSSCDEEAIISECKNNHNWSPSTQDLKKLISKYVVSNRVVSV